MEPVEPAPVDECESTVSPCANGGECTDTEQGFVCACNVRFTGPACEHLKFRGIGLIQGQPNSWAAAISADGSFILGSAGADLETQAPVRFPRELGSVPQALGTPIGWSQCQASAISGDGAWVGGSCSGDGGFAGFTWTPSTGALAVVTPEDIPVRYQGSTPNGKVRTGSLMPSDGYQQPFRWTAATGYVGLPISEPGDHEGWDISDDGSTIVGDYLGPEVGSVRAAFRWTTTSSTTYLPVPVGLSGQIARAISGDGSVIVGYAETEADTARALRWSGSAMQPDDLGDGFMFDVNHDGSVMVGMNGANEIVIWKVGTFNVLVTLLDETPDLEGWILTDAVAISADGKWVTGNGTHDGHEEGWIARLPD